MTAVDYLSVELVAFDNDNSAFIPEHWAQESLAILEENMPVANLVHRDFSEDIRQFGDVVNTRRPAERTGRRRTDADDYTANDISATNVPVKLDQWFYDSFIVKDGEQSYSFADLVSVYLRPAVQNIARQVDRAILGRVHEFVKTPLERAGRLGAMSSSTAAGFVLDAHTIMNQQKAYADGRNLVVSPISEAGLLGTNLFVSAEQRGDGGSALESARVGRIYSFNTYMAQNTPYVNAVNCDTVAGTVTNALAAGGSGSQVVAVTGYEAVAGEYAVVAGNDQPSHITARTASTNTTAVTLNEANKYATAAGAAIVVYKKCDVKGVFPAGYTKEVVVDGHTANKGPQVGQLISFGTGGSRHTYTVIERTVVSTTETKLLLDRPLDAPLGDGDAAFPGPAGSFNLGFHRDAIALVTRPVALPAAAGTSVMAANASYNNLGMRVVMQYDSTKGGTRVNLDILAGVKVLDPKLGVLLLG